MLADPIEVVLNFEQLINSHNPRLGALCQFRRVRVTYLVRNRLAHPPPALAYILKKRVWNERRVYPRFGSVQSAIGVG
jgi:hypothetical protein